MLTKNIYSIMKDKEHHTETHCKLILKHLSSGKHIGLTLYEGRVKDALPFSLP